MRVSPSALNAQLERGLVGAYILFGAEPLMLEEAADQIRTVARQAGVDEVRSMTAGVDLDWSELNANARSLSLFSSRRLTVIRLPTGKPGDAGSKAIITYLDEKVEEIKCFPIFVSKKFQIPNLKNVFLTGDAFYSFPPSFAQGASQSIEAANDLFNDLENNSSNYYKTRILKTKQINSRSSLNHFAFHLSNPLNVFFRDIFLKYLSKNKNFLENYLGKIYSN